MDKTILIRALNDRLRTTGAGGRMAVAGELCSHVNDAVMMTEVFGKLREFDSFDDGNDPHREHDFGAFDLTTGRRVMWKIEYYSRDLRSGSEDPSDPAKTTRVLTVFFAEDY